MELFVAVVILALLGVLATRFGYDSRDGMPSKEYDLARYGVAWETPRAQVGASAPAGGRTAAERHALSEPPMHLALLKLSPAEFAALAEDLGPDGAAAFAASWTPGTVAVRRAARAPEPLGDDRGQSRPVGATPHAGGVRPIVAAAETA